MHVSRACNGWHKGNQKWRLTEFDQATPAAKDSPSYHNQQEKRSHAGARGEGKRPPFNATALFTCCRDDSGARERGPAGRYGEVHEVAERLGAIRQVHCGNVMRCMCQYARHASSRKTLLYTAMIRSRRYLASASSA